jgi:hypothetical protein
VVSFTPWLSGTITGFVYLCAVFFLFLSFAHKDLKFLTKLHPFEHCVAVVVVFFSYVLGMTGQYVCQAAYYMSLPHRDYYLAKVVLFA